jgi:hypothetical protein
VEESELASDRAAGAGLRMFCLRDCECFFQRRSENEEEING